VTADRFITKPRLLILASTYPRWPNDHEPSFVHALARRLTDRFDVIAVVPHAPGSKRHEILDGVKVSRYRYAPVSMETLINDGGIAANLRGSPWKWLLLPSFIFMQWFEARRQVRKGSVIHAHWLIPQGIVARMMRRPTLLTCHGADVFSLRGKAASLAKKFALASAGAVTVVSEAMVDPVVRLSPAVVPKVRPMGVDLTNAFTPGEGARDVAHLLFVGRLVEKKGLDVLLRAMPTVVAAHPSVRLTIVGHGPLDGRLRAEVARRKLSGNVSFTGPLTQDRLVPLYRSASLFVSPFRATASGDQEGLGLVMVEALGCGCPVVASDLPATRDILLGTPGCVMVASEDANALASALIAMLDAPDAVQQAAMVGARLMRERFDWSSVARGYGDILESLAMRALP
jgi:glycosyltransferase involved in cell wall biosynthesis